MANNHLRSYWIMLNPFCDRIWIFQLSSLSYEYIVSVLILWNDVKIPSNFLHPNQDIYISRRLELSMKPSTSDFPIPNHLLLHVTSCAHLDFWSRLVGQEGAYFPSSLMASLLFSVDDDLIPYRMHRWRANSAYYARLSIALFLFNGVWRPQLGFMD